MIYFSQYQSKANETAIFPKEVALSYVTLGLVGEAGEIANKVKKVIRDGRSTDGIADELGDVLWYLAVLAETLGEDLGQIADKNLQKLASRKERGVLGGSGDNR